MKYEYHTKLPLESYQNRFCMILVVILYDIHTSFFAVYVYLFRALEMQMTHCNGQWKTRDSS